MVQFLFYSIDFMFSFKGRIGRLAYWAYSLGIWAAIFFLAFALGAFDTTSGDTVYKTVETDDEVLFAIIFGILFIGLIWSSYAVQAKRWHDRNKSGWWSMIGFIPYIGGIWILVECGFLRGTDGANRYGEAPGSSSDNLAEVFE